MGSIKNIHGNTHLSGLDNEERIGLFALPKDTFAGRMELSLQDVGDPLQLGIVERLQQRHT